MDEYVHKFDELKSFMKHKHGQLDEDYYINSFISGLKGEVKHMVELLTPVSVEQAILMARKQEALVDAVNKGKGGKLVTGTKVVKFGAEAGKIVGNGNEKSSYIKKLSQEEIDDRKKEGIVFQL